MTGQSASDIKQRQPFITIAVPVYNRADMVERTLNSIFAQDYRPISLIVVDNASTDNSLEVVQRWAELHRDDEFCVNVIGCDTPGASAARNAAFEQCVTEWIMWFDSDDVMLQGHISSVVRTISEHSDVNLVYWAKKIIDTDGWTRVVDADHWHPMVAQLLHGTFSTVAMAIKVSFVRQCDLWPQNIGIWDDFVFALRLLANPDIKIVKRHGDPCHLVYDSGQQSITGASWISRADGLLQAIDMMWQIVEPFAELRPYALSRMATVAAHFAREGHNGQSRILLNRALSLMPSLKDKLKLRTVFAIVRLFGRGGAATAQCMWPMIKPKS